MRVAKIHLHYISHKVGIIRLGPRSVCFTV